MSLFLAIVCFGAAIAIFYLLHRMDMDPDIPGPVTHVILPAAAYPIMIVLIILGSIALIYYQLGQ